MSIVADTLWCLARSGCVALLCVAAGSLLTRLPGRSSRLWRAVAWGAILAPFLAPGLLVGYSYSNFSLSLVRHPGWNEALYCLLIALRLAPVAAVALIFAPSAVSHEALYCRRLAAGRRGGGGLREAVSFGIHGPLRVLTIAWAATFLLAFGEFELASLMGVRAWTVRLFDAHAGGLALSASLRLVLLPVVVQLLVLAVALPVLFAQCGSGKVMARGPQPRSALPRAAAVLWAAAACIVVVLIPAGIVLRGAAAGLRVAAQRPGLVREVGAGLLFGASAACLAFLAAGPFCGTAGGRGFQMRRAIAAALASLPGLLGALVVALVTVWLFQALAPGLYDTPIPLIGALALVLLPFAILLRVLLTVLEPGESVYAAELLGAAAEGPVRRRRHYLLWQLRLEPRFWALFLLFCWGYLDLTASAILAPPGTTPVTVRLYNLMHYGRTEVLSAMLCIAVCVPVLIVVLAGGAGRLLNRRLAHG
jgi:ABC-type Fe3+ transport system permease subunit